MGANKGKDDMLLFLFKIERANVTTNIDTPIAKVSPLQGVIPQPGMDWVHHKKPQSYVKLALHFLG